MLLSKLSFRDLQASLVFASFSGIEHCWIQCKIPPHLLSFLSGISLIWLYARESFFLSILMLDNR